MLRGFSIVDPERFVAVKFSTARLRKLEWDLFYSFNAPLLLRANQIKRVRSTRLP